MEYDYIICGGGTAGCVIASRLAENLDMKVLVIEAGTDNKDIENINMPGGWTGNFDTERDWNFITPPMTGLNNRQVKMTRGKVLGGSSAVHATLCIRGTPQDFDDWQLDGWSGREIFDYMKKENESSHGYSGPLHLEPHNPAPISGRLIESFVSKGLSFHEDMFSSGNTPHGCGHAPRTVHNGLRTMATDYFRYKNIKNLVILTNTLVDRILTEPNGLAHRAVGVITWDADGEQHKYRAKREIIITGGSLCSPAILLRSGIGPRAELQANDIPCVIDLPGVGKNLQDHMVVFMFYETDKEGLTTDHFAYHDNNYAKSELQWKETKTGFLASAPFGPVAFARLDERLKDEPLWRNSYSHLGRDPMGLTNSQPNVEFFTTECYGGPKQNNQFPVNHQHTFGIFAELFSPRSRGSVTLKSKNPHESPIINCNYLADPLDILVLAEACNLANEIITQGSGTKDIVKGPWPSSLNFHSFRKWEDWVPYVRERATTCYHPAGTCAMGMDDNPTAVLDNKLRVRGVSGLRVGDCSVMPLLNNGHTLLPVFGIAEKCANLIKETWDP
ncbi:putative GMC oxidoreductase [Xylogone sp. PMI_703]|nr:putative GMC oxidoreductase [Xylogone sp. PMI_703]